MTKLLAALLVLLRAQDGIRAAPRPEIVAGGAAILALWLSLERVLGIPYRPKEAG